MCVFRFWLAFAFIFVYLCFASILRLRCFLVRAVALSQRSPLISAHSCSSPLIFHTVFTFVVQLFFSERERALARTRFLSSEVLFCLALGSRSFCSFSRESTANATVAIFIPASRDFSKRKKTENTQNQRNQQLRKAE